MSGELVESIDHLACFGFQIATRLLRVPFVVHAHQELVQGLSRLPVLGMLPVQIVLESLMAGMRFRRRD